MAEAEDFEHITAAVSDRILTITIVRPQVHNALHPPACREIGAVLDALETRTDADVAIITGAGEKAFSAGFDLRWANEHPEVLTQPLIASEITRRQGIGKPLIAAVNGLALGLGFELALACDLIVAAKHARFGLPEARVGLAAMAGGVVRLTREIGPKRALGMILTGNMCSADEGLRAGFVNEIADGDVLAAARRWAASIAECSPLSLRASKEMAYRSADLPDMAAALDPRSYPAVTRVLESEDAVEGRRAFLENRKPQWRGR
jgi:enoyl-CoA hydratase/carnithine racemase